MKLSTLIAELQKMQDAGFTQVKASDGIENFEINSVKSDSDEVVVLKLVYKPREFSQCPEVLWFV